MKANFVLIKNDKSKMLVLLSRAERRSAAAEYESPSFVARYNFYDGDKHCQDYLYPITRSDTVMPSS